MKTTVIGRIWLWSLAVFLSVAVGSSCQIKQVSPEGATATQVDNVDLLEGGPHEGRWGDSNIIVNYIYNNQSDAFEFKGSVELAPGLTGSFNMVNNFHVRANFLDQEKKILKSITIIIADRQPIRVWRFAHNLDITPETRSINFSYSGQAREGGRRRSRVDDGIETSFWRVP